MGRLVRNRGSEAPKLSFMAFEGLGGCRRVQAKLITIRILRALKGFIGFRV